MTNLLRQAISFKCFMKPKSNTIKIFAPACFPIRSCSQKMGFESSSIKSLQRKKKLFAIALFSTTFIIVWHLKKRKRAHVNELLQECRRIPIEKELFDAKVSLYRYNGFIFPDHIVLSGVFQQLKQFQFRADDVVVASFPKSGTTWIQEIVYMLKNDCKKSDGSSEILETRFPYLEYPYPGIKSVSAMRGKRFIKTHLPFDLLPESFVESGAKMIYLIRNPRDVATSYWYFMRLLTTIGFTGSFHEFIDLFLGDKVPYGPYFDHLRSYLKERDCDNVLILSYEETKRNPVQSIKAIAEFLKINISQDDAEEVAASTTFMSMLQNASVNYEHWKDIGFAVKDGRFLRKGVVGDWKNHFSEEKLKEFKTWESGGSKDLGYEFLYDLKTQIE